MSDLDVALLMGSANDWKHLEPAVAVLDRLGLAYRVHVSSAHRTPDRTHAVVRRALEDGCKVFVCAAGMAAHLAGVVASLTVRPVLGVPLPGGVLDGVDALLSTVQMPPGVPVATFAVGPAGARNAAFFAAQVVALERPEVAERLAEARRASEREIEARERELLAAREAGRS
jgi:5-(carboxyamino)imidazole ribonucleotide mutase